MTYEEIVKKKQTQLKQLRVVTSDLNNNSIITLGLAITGISVWWVRTTLKEGNKVLEENQKENLDN